MSSVYIHIPFCERKCFYCDFYSITGRERVGIFLDALRREIELSKDRFAGDTIETIFFGGGTPSLLTPSQVENIIGQIYKNADVANNVETTIEVNPGTIDKQKLKGYISAGINRLSIGIQSFNDDELKFLQRIHSSDDAERAILDAQECGIGNCSIDLIYALPYQTPVQWQAILAKALSFHPQHISAYSLIVEEDTPLASKVLLKEILPLADDEEAAMYAMTMDVLRDAGYQHYEVSNYALPGYACRHNANYWNHSNYIGVGPSAHSFMDGKRWWNVRDVDSYCNRLSGNKPAVAGEEILTEQQMFEEAIMLGLRTGELICSQLRAKFQVDIMQQAGPMIRMFIKENLVSLEKDRIRLTEKGFLLCDEIIERLLTVV